MAATEILEEKTGAPITNYLLGPRIHFGGKFWADVPTQNNLTDYWKSANLPQEDFQHDVDQIRSDSNFNVLGGGQFRFDDCHVTGEISSGGTTAIGAPGPDGGSLVGSLVKSISNDSFASAPHMVDLNVTAQLLTSTVFGMKLQLINKLSVLLEGEFEPDSIQYFWKGALEDQPYKNTGARAVFLSVLKNVSRPSGVENYPILQELFDSTYGDADGYTFTVKFLVDNYKYKAGVMSGDITGLIGIYPHSSYPKTVFVGRHLLSNKSHHDPAFGTVQATVSDEYLVLDLSNALPKNKEGSEYSSYWGDLMFTFGKGSTRTLLLQLSSSIYATKEFLFRDAGIFKERISVEQAQALKTQLLQVQGAGGGVLAEELPTSDGLYIQAEPRWARMQCGWQGDETYPVGEELKIKLVTMRYGELFTGGAISILSCQPEVSVHDSQAYNTGVTWEMIPNLTHALDGQVLTVRTPPTIKVPGSSVPPRSQYNMDSCIYQVEYKVATENGSFEVTMDKSGVICLPVQICVFDEYTIPIPTEWTRDIEPEMHVFNNIYPVMAHRGLKLDDKDNILDPIWLDRTIDRMSAGYYSAGLMPVTRDLSPAKLTMIIRWLVEQKAKNPP